MTGWAKPKPSERLEYLRAERFMSRSEYQRANSPAETLADARWEALCQFLDEDAEQRNQERRPDAQV